MKPSNRTNIKDKIFKKDWTFYVTRKFNWFVENTQILANAKGSQEKYVGFDLSQTNYLILNGDEYYTEAENEKFNTELDSQLSRDREFFTKFANTIFNLVQDVKAYTMRLETLAVNKLTGPELANEINRFQEEFTKSFIPAFTRP